MFDDRCEPEWTPSKVPAVLHHTEAVLQAAPSQDGALWLQGRPHMGGGLVCYSAFPSSTVITHLHRDDLFPASL